MNTADTATKMKRRYWSLKKVTIAFVCVAIFVILLLTIFEGHLRGLVSEWKRNYGTSYINLTEWKRLKFESCNGNFIGYGHQFAVLKNVLLTPEDDKFYIPCGKTLPKYQFDYEKDGTHLNRWMEQIETVDKLGKENTALNTAKHIIKDKLVVAVLRYEYANLYHTITDWYNVFILAKLLNEPIDDVEIILFDQNVPGHLDETWVTLFQNVIFRNKLPETIFCSQLAWGILGYESPINFHAAHTLPFIQDFHKFFIRKNGIHETKLLDCVQPVITFIWRRDYVAHPNNPTGLISRKVKNEEELISHMQAAFPRASVKGVQLDQLSFKRQLETIVNTDILISMHGAGLSHILFLPPHAGVVEMFPLYWKKYFGASHFRAMAKWRHLKYSAWQNLNPSNEVDKFYTYVPPSSLESHISPIYKQICPVG